MYNSPDGYYLMNYSRKEEEMMTTAVTERYEFSINSTENLTSFFNATASSLFPQDDGEFEDIEAIKGKVSVSVFISFTFIFLVGLIGNILVVTVVVANPMMRSTTNILILNLAISDLLFVIFCVPFTATDYILNYWPFGDQMCSFVQYMIAVTCHASVYTLVMMSLDRFLAVVHPISSISYRTEQNAIIAIKIIWLFIVLASLPWFFAHGEIIIMNVDPDTGATETIVGCIFLYRGFNYPTYQITFFMTSYVIPLTLISALYVGMLVKLWRGQAPGGKPSLESRRGKKRVTQMVVAVVLAFAICWLPIQIILVLKSMNPTQQSTVLIITMQIVSHVLAYSSSCVNPILYAFLSENFRKALKKVVRCGEKPAMLTQNEKQTNTTKTIHLKLTGRKDIDHEECADIV